MQDNRVQLPLDCIAYYIADFIPEDERESLYVSLLTQIKWNKRGNGRKAAIYGNEGSIYQSENYQNIEVTPWTEEMQRVKDLVESSIGETFNVAVCNYY